ncbi:hypothetical protein C8R45DRAFT_1075814, partial [Mycena sanguinolenta]
MVPEYVLRRYSKAWAPNATVFMLWVPLNAWTLVNRALAPTLQKTSVVIVICLFFFFATHNICLLVLRGHQVWQYVQGTAFSKSEYYWPLYSCCIYGFLVHNFLYFVLEICVMDEFRQYMGDIMVIRAADYFVRADSIPQISTKTRILRKINHMLCWFRRPQGEHITLPHDRALEMDASLVASIDSPSFSFNFNPELKENVIHWYRMSSNSHTSKPLWVTTYNNNWCVGLSRMMAEFLSSNDSDSRPGVTLVDVSQTHTVFWPVTRGLMSACPEYTREIGGNPPFPFDDYFNWLVDLSNCPGDVQPFLDDDNPQRIITRLFCSPLRAVYRRLTDKILTSGSTDVENVVARAPTTLVIHGVRDTVQSNELYETIGKLEFELGEYYTWIRIVIISRPELLRHVSDTDPEIMQHVCTMYLPDIGPIIYSGKHSSPPLLNENVFLLLLDGIHRSGGSEAERVVWQTSKLSLEGN